MDWLQITVQSNGKPIAPERENTVGFLNEAVKAFGQIVFTENLPEKDIEVFETSTRIRLDYALNGQADGNVQISLTTYSVTDNLEFYVDQQTINDYFNPIITENINSPLTNIEAEFAEPFNYQAELKINNLNYIAVRESGMIPKFANDPLFNLVFINNKVAIFEVKK